MDIIKQVEIKNFRSFGNRKGETTVLSKVDSVNVLSGANDSGKSNILRALNLFFNGHTDLNAFFDFECDFFKKSDPDELDIKEEVVSIKVWFRNSKNDDKNSKQSQKAFLPSEFWVIKRWKKTSQYSSSGISSNIETQFRNEKRGVAISYFLDNAEKLKSVYKASLQKQLTDFLSQIQYHYVPAIKDREYFSHLYGELQQTLWKARSSVIDLKKDDFQSEIQKETKLLMEEFKDTISSPLLDCEPVFRLPENLVDLFRTLQVQTGDIELAQRGDGVQAKLIPEILSYISIKEKSYTSRSVRSNVLSKKYFIWGFEEPENSYEYANAQLLANRFRDKFSHEAQIFITTHSFNFLSMTGPKVSTYRVWRDVDVSASRISRIRRVDGEFDSEDGKLSDSYRLNNELGVFRLNAELERLFLETEKVRVGLESRLDELKRQGKYMLVEDKYDQIYKAAWMKLNDIEFDLNNLEDVFLGACHFKILGMQGAGSVSGLLRSKNTAVFEDSKIVGVFDFDKAGAENFYHLKKEKFWDDNVDGSKLSGLYRKRTDGAHFYGMLLPVPDRLKLLADLSHTNFSNYVEIENLLPENFLTVNNFVTEQLIAGVKYLEVKDKCKGTLWNQLTELTKEDFIDFVPLFAAFDRLTQ